jgi:DNA-binding MarR family transcriptional regulator
MRKEKNKLSGAPVRMHEIGKATDSAVLSKAIRTPGITVSDLAEALGWSNGRVDGSVNRLVTMGKLKVKHVLQRGMLLKRIYLNTLTNKPNNIIELPHKMISESLWSKGAFVYALSRSTIGISPEKVEEWESKAILKECLEMERNRDNVLVTLPEKLSNFYQLENSDISLSGLGDIALVTVESILPVALPPTYPEESRMQTFLYRIKRELDFVQYVGSNSNFIFVRAGLSVEVQGSSCSSYFDLSRKYEKTFSATNAEPREEIIEVPMVTE